MNLLKKSLLIAFAFFLGTECGNTGNQKKLKDKLQKTRKEVAQIFKTDNQQKIAQEVKAVNAQTQTPQEKQQVNVALQQEVVKETKKINAELAQVAIQDQNYENDYIDYYRALDIIKSKKELSLMKKSSWTNSLIIKPFTKTYRLYLRLSNKKEYDALLEKERIALEHALNVQAFNNIKLLQIALDFQGFYFTTQFTRFLHHYDLDSKTMETMIEYMFKKDNFYTITIHAFEGGGLFSSDIKLSKQLKSLFTNLNESITYYLADVSKSSRTIQSIWEMTQVIQEAQELIKANNPKKENIPYDVQTIQKLCIEAAKKNNQILHIKKSYPQYLKDWISQPKNLAKAGLVMAAIGGLYLYGPAIPAWLKEYKNSSIGSIKASIAKGYQTTISSVKNLWNKVRGNQIQELPDSTESKRDAQEQELSTDEYFIRKGRLTAQEMEINREVEDKIAANRQEWLNEEEQMLKRRRQEAKEDLARIEQQELQYQAMQEDAAFKEQQRAGQMANEFDAEMQNEELMQNLQDQSDQAFVQNAQQETVSQAIKEAEILERKQIVEQARQEQQQEFDYYQTEEDQELAKFKQDSAQQARERMTQEARTEEKGDAQTTTQNRVGLNPTSGEMDPGSRLFSERLNQESAARQKQENPNKVQARQDAQKELQNMTQFEIDPTLNPQSENKRMGRFKYTQNKALADIAALKEDISNSNKNIALTDEKLANATGKFKELLEKTQIVNKEIRLEREQLLEESKQYWSQELNSLEKQLENARQTERTKK